MQLIVIDFETFFDKENYTLRKMTTEAYLRDPRFEVHGCGIKFPGEPARWYRKLPAIDWQNTAIICHHAHFDAGILAFHYGIRPALIIDTLSMARAIVGTHIKANLNNLSERFGLPAKFVPYHLFEGKHWNELDRPVQQQVAAGCCHDVELCWDIFCRLAKQFPAEEYALVDATVRMFTEPCLVGDTDKLVGLWREEEVERNQLLDQLRVSGSDLRSDEAFAELLRDEGIEPPLKKTTAGETYAFAKTDQFMRDLQDDDRVRVSALAAARLAQRSNIVQTRSKRLAEMSTRGPLPVYLGFCGAHTTRWGGGDKCLDGGTKVTVFDPQKGLTKKAIVDILLDDLVWDGEEFVPHEGVVFQGFKEVITYDGLTGTRDHKVYLAQGGVATLEEAKLRGFRLERTRKPSPKQVRGRGKNHSQFDDER